MSRCFIFLLFSILIASTFSAQNTAYKTQLPEIVYMANPVQVTVDNDGQVDNLLVVISDSSGQTIFLDNRFRFVGSYSRSVDLSRSGKGPYRLCIAKDAERTYTRFYLK